MAALCRLAGRQICSKFANYERNSLMFVRAVTIQPQPHKPKPIEKFDDMNMRIGRPLSPHLLIYAPQVTSMLSITHRMTGLTMSAYIIFFGWSCYLPMDLVTYVASWNPGAITILFLKAAIAFPFSYHFCNGIRHLTWDLGKCLGMKEVYNTGYFMLLVASALTAGLIML